MNFAIAPRLILLLSIGTQTPIERPSPSDDVRCGSYCLFVALSTMRACPETLEQLEQSIGSRGPTGYSMLQLQEEANRRGLATAMAETTLDNLLYRRSHLGETFVCITLIDERHFVLLWSIEKGLAQLCDPPRMVQISDSTLQAHWSKKVLSGVLQFHAQVCKNRQDGSDFVQFWSGAHGCGSIRSCQGLSRFRRSCRTLWPSMLTSSLTSAAAATSLSTSLG